MTDIAAPARKPFSGPTGNRVAARPRRAARGRMRPHAASRDLNPEIFGSAARGDDRDSQRRRPACRLQHLRTVGSSTTPASSANFTNKEEPRPQTVADVSRPSNFSSGLESSQLGLESAQRPSEWDTVNLPAGPRRLPGEQRPEASQTQKAMRSVKTAASRRSSFAQRELHTSRRPAPDDACLVPLESVMDRGAVVTYAAVQLSLVRMRHRRACRPLQPGTHEVSIACTDLPPSSARPRPAAPISPS